MIIERLLLYNVGPFLSEWEVEFGLGVTAIVAEYDDSPLASNRAGKSWLGVDAPLYALHGKFRGGVDDLVHRLAAGQEEGFVDMTVRNSEGTAFTIRRGRSKGGDAIRTLDGASIKDAELEEVVLKEILGLTHREHLLTTAFVQGDMHAFMKMPAAEKRRVVSPWFQTDRWIPRYDLARKRLTQAQSALKKIDTLEERLNEIVKASVGARHELETEVGIEVAAREELQAAMEEVASAKAAEEADAAKVAEAWAADAEVTRLEEELKAERTRRESEVTRTEERTEESLTLLKAANGRKDAIRQVEERAGQVDELRESVAAVREDLSNARATGEAAKTSREELLRKYEALTKDLTGTCPILGEPCERVERDEAVVQEVRTSGLKERRAIDRAARRAKEFEWKLDMSRADLLTAEEAAEKLEELRGQETPAQAESRYEAAAHSRDQAEAALSNLKLGRTETGRALKRARKAAEGLGDAGTGETTRAMLDASQRRTEAEAALRTTEGHLATARANVAALDEAEAELKGIADRRKAARAEVEKLAWTAYAFGSSGIPSRELENAFGVAEDAMNRVLSDVGAPTQLRFSPSRELKDWEPACLACGEVFRKGTRRHECSECGVPRRKKRRDELRLEVLDGEYTSAFELDSGGGQVLLSLGTRLGLATLPGSSRRVRCEGVIIDEPDGALDVPNRTALHRLLTNRLPALGIRQAILITHADVRHEFDSVVVVKRWADEDRSGAWKE